jgi:hypothetical protein
MTTPVRGLGTPPERYMALAESVTARLLAEHPELDERYGERGRAFGVHDTAYQIAWIVNAVELDAPQRLRTDMVWLRDVLAARHFPIPVLRRNFELAIAICADEGLAGREDLHRIATPVLHELRE